MSELEFRPRSRTATGLSKEAVRERLVQRIAMDDLHHIELGGTGDHLVLQFAEKVKHAWTPQMDVDLEVVDGTTWVRSLIGPSPSIWMLFVGGYLFAAILALLGLSIGVAQQVVGATPWGFMMVAPTPFMALGLWLMAQAGKARSKEEMWVLKRILNDAVGEEQDR